MLNIHPRYRPSLYLKALTFLPAPNPNPLFPSLLTFSLHFCTNTSNSTSFAASYLIHNFGFTPQFASKLCSAHRLRFKTTQKPESVLTFFRNYGFSESQLRHMIPKMSRLLSCDPSKRVLAKFQFFLSKGASNSDIVNLVTKTPIVLSPSLNNHIVPTYELLYRFLQSHKDTIAVLNPASIISSIESILINFFWGGSEDNRKVAWVDWNSICMSKGCWRFGDLRGFMTYRCTRVGRRWGAWRWRRRLLAWEEDLVLEIRNLLSNITLQESEADVYIWCPNIGVGYTVRGVYHMLMRQEIHSYDVTADAPWHKSVPLKVSICAWRLFHNRWPTKDNLVRRGVITNENQLCVSGCGEQETIDHLIIHCTIFGDLWKHIKSWIGVYSVDPQQVTDHFYQFVHSSIAYTPRRSFLHLVWLCCMWVLWTERNHILFTNKTITTVQLVEKMKMYSFRWLKAKNVCFPFGYHMWWQNPLACLGIGRSLFFIYNITLQDFLM
ncbi:putative transcription regulator mTERF family [Medicago truncatula]|uniref:Putative transcription regulator mTERF family n=1 Tax=Medicago truncatula TaxID=3880 RepID=A0A396JA77_MEDTR|nr:putative transcription regulator mTERF family [Medicago truncatula]